MSAIKESIVSGFGSLALPKWVLVLLRLVFAAGLLLLIYRQLSDQTVTTADLRNLVHTPQQYGAVLAVVVLMFVNWGLEIAKWRKIVSVFQVLSLPQASAAVLSGISLAIVTPGRVGEYGGRLLHISRGSKSKALVGNAVSSLAQNIANISGGLLGLVGYAVLFLDMGRVSLVSTLTLIVPFVAMLVVLIYRLDLVERLLERLPQSGFVQRWIRDNSSVLALYDSKAISNILLLSVARYSTYVLQYGLLVMVCGITTDPLYALVGVSVIFLIQTGIPLPPMLSVLARGEVAIWVWAVCSSNVLAILAATFLLWFINLVLPAIVGVFVIWSSRRAYEQ